MEQSQLVTKGQEPLPAINKCDLPDNPILAAPTATAPTLDAVVTSDDILFNIS